MLQQVFTLVVIRLGHSVMGESRILIVDIRKVGWPNFNVGNGKKLEDAWGPGHATTSTFYRVDHFQAPS